MNYYNEIKNILIYNAIGRKVREYKSTKKIWKAIKRVENF